MIQLLHHICHSKRQHESIGLENFTIQHVSWRGYLALGSFRNNEKITFQSKNR